MAFIPVPDTCQVQVVCNWDGQIVENVYHVEFSAGPSLEDMQLLAADVTEWWEDNISVNAPTTLSLIKVVVTLLDLPESPSIEWTIGMPMPGTYTGTYLPNNVTLAVKWITALRGRSYRGRTYHFPMEDEWVVQNTVTNGALATLVGIYTALMTVINGVAGREMVVASKYHANAPRTTGVTTPITGLSIDSTVDSQRRRLPGRGR